MTNERAVSEITLRVEWDPDVEESPDAWNWSDLADTRVWVVSSDD